MGRKIILHIITGLAVGGAERSLYSLLSAGLARRYETHVLSLTGRGHYGAFLEAEGVTVHDLAMRPGAPSVAGLYRLAKLSRHLRPVLIHGWMYHANLVATLARWLTPDGPRLVWGIRHSLDSSSDDSRSTHLARKLGSLTSGAADAIVYNSATARFQHRLAGYRRDRDTVIPNGFETERWHPNSAAREAIRRELGILPDDLVVGFVGRFHPTKDLPNFYAAVAPLMGRHERLHCVIVGRDAGASNPALTAAIAALPASRTHLLGQRSDVEHIMPGFDFLCLSSRGEGFPNVVGEAMSCAVPCVVTDVGDAAAIVGETGFVAQSKDSRALSDALDRMASLPEWERRALGMKARARIHDNFSLTATARQYDELYHSMITG